MKEMIRKVSGTYDAALYLRLSRDDVDIDGSAKTESNSIGSQRELLRNYVKNQPDIQIFDIYVDDGYSGSNFDRPEFKRMTSDIEAGRVNCVIVKDLSRFGRDYIEAGRLIQKIYPAFSVRFIAITDNYDSLTADLTESSLVVPIKNFVNDSYCRDISQKVRSQQGVKRENGDFIGAFAPFGYEKATDNKNQLVIDPYAAEIVKKIFAWKIEGLSLGKIASRLNSLHVLCPKQYKLSRGLNYHSGFDCRSEAKWSAPQVKRILTNKVYIGTLIQGRQERISYKIKKRLDKPESDWVKVEHAHEGIIRESDFTAVQKLLKYDGRASKSSDSSNLLAGYLFCGDCNTPMIRRVNKYKGKERVFYICQTKNKGGDCTRHSIPEDMLKTIVLKEIQMYSALFMDYDAVISELKKMEVGYDQVVEYDTQIARLQTEYNRYYALKTSLYDDLKDGLIGKEEFEEFRKIYGDKCEQLQKSIEGQKQILKDMFQNGVAASVQLEEWKKSLELKELDRTLLALAVDRICVYEGKKLEITLRYQNVIEKMKVMYEFFSGEFIQKEQPKEAV